MSYEIQTVNRRRLMNAAKKGKLFVRCDGHYTDDYLYDAATNFGKMDNFLPVKMIDPSKSRLDQFEEGKVLMDEDDFRTNSGRAWARTIVREDGLPVRVITLKIHSNLTYTVEIR